MAFAWNTKQWKSLDEFAAHLATVDTSWVKRVTIHHTYIPVQADWRGTSTMNGMRNHYRDTLKWSAGPHLFLIVGAPNPAHDGIWQGTPLNTRGIHAGDCNNDAIGVEVVGNFDLGPWSPQLAELVYGVVMALVRKRELPASAVVGHRECLPNKTCPGKKINMDSVRSEVARRLAVPQGDGLTFIHPPRISRAVFQRVLETGTRFGPSPAAPIADELYDICVTVGVDPALALAFAAHEHEYMTNPDSLTVRHSLNNWANTRSPYDPTAATIVPIPGRGNFARYPDYQTSIRDWCRRMRYWYAAGKVPGHEGRIMATVEAAIPVYAPASDQNKPQAYIDHVRRLVAAWEQESAVDKYEQAWGRDDYQAGHGIEQRYRQEMDAGRPLGKAISNEEPLTDAYAVRAFERGVIGYRRIDGVTAVARW